jgi:hydroxyethylthiazole kinase-like uncharacterized protein yjeF
MKPVVTPEEMRAADVASEVPEQTLIERAGWAVAAAARRMMGGSYGRQVVVIAGKGNNGADGRVAAAVLARRGARVVVVDATDPRVPVGADLVIDAAYGTGFRGDYAAPDVHGAPVLAVDIPSGVSGTTGVATDGAVRAQVTVTFAALKPGLLLGSGAERSGRIEVADIGLRLAGSTMHMVERSDVRAACGPAARESHKWKAALLVVAGSPGMMGAVRFVTEAAARSGAGMVRVGSPGVTSDRQPATEAVAIDLSSSAWPALAKDEADRAHAVVIGPGIGRDPATLEAVRRLVAELDLPMVIDGDGLFALGEMAPDILRRRRAATVLTPHDGEFVRMCGRRMGDDRVAEVRGFAAETGATVLLKGSTTLVASPTGDVRLVTTGDARLATAGTGDVLSGVVGAFLARGMDGSTAASCGAFVHGAAARHGFERGLTAGDLPVLVAGWLSDLAKEEQG